MRFLLQGITCLAVNFLWTVSSTAQPAPHPWDVGRDIVARDARLTVTRDTDTLFEPLTFGSLEVWEDFADALRFRIRVASGLWPEPERTPLNARVFDPIERDGYTISKVHFEAYPGFLVTGNLYTPAGDGPFPGVLCPHGHWEHGRFEDSEVASVSARCITFARMGIVAFSYDMVGYNDSLQFPREWGHDRDALPLDERRAEEFWGVHPFGVQLWSSIRALDFLESLPDVDGERLACTGASGGGTQTFALCAVDDRVKVAAPVNMISHRMQGGDVCENAPLIRFTASNVEIGALMAPRPLLMVSAAGDWTRDTPEVEYPAIRRIYGLYDAADRVDNVHIRAPHNFNQESREAVYRFFGKWLLGEEEKYANFTEPPYAMEPVEDLRVFPNGLPEGTPGEDEIVRNLVDTARARAHRFREAAKSDEAFRAAYQNALELAIGIRSHDLGPVVGERLSRERHDGYLLERWVVRATSTGAVAPAVLLVPSRRPKSPPVIYVHPEGKSALADHEGMPLASLVQACVEERRLVAVIDVFGVGERVAVRRESTRYPDTFSPSDAAYRVQDILTASAWLLRRKGRQNTVVLRGVSGAARWCALAASLRPETIRTTVERSSLPGIEGAHGDALPIPLLGLLGGVNEPARILGASSVGFVYNPPNSLD